MDQEAKPVTREVKIPAVLECGFDQIIEIGNLEAPSIVIVDHLVDRVEGIELRRQKMTRGCLPEYAKAIIA